MSKLSAIGSQIRMLDSGEIATINAIELRQDATYIMVMQSDSMLESKINILNEGRVFEYLN